MRKLPRLKLARAAQRGVKVVVVTHSSLLLLAIQTMVSKGALSGNDTVLHWFTRDERTGLTTIDTAVLDDKGTFGEWPEDFGNVFLEAEGRFLNAVEE